MWSEGVKQIRAFLKAPYISCDMSSLRKRKGDRMCASHPRESRCCTQNMSTVLRHPRARLSRDRRVRVVLLCFHCVLCWRESREQISFAMPRSSTPSLGGASSSHCCPVSIYSRIRILLCSYCAHLSKLQVYEFIATPGQS